MTRDDVFELLAVARFGACAASSDGTVVFWNRRAAQIAGLAASEVTGRPLRDVLAGAAARLSSEGAPFSPIPLAGHVFAGYPSGFGQRDDDVLSVYLFDDSPAVDSGSPPSASSLPADPGTSPAAAGDLRRPAASNPLSRRETEIVRLVAAGVPTEAIAEQLRISVHTVRNHVRSLRRKLGAKTKLDAVVIAMRHGLLSPGAA